MFDTRLAPKAQQRHKTKTKYKIQNTEYRIQNTKDKRQKTKAKRQNTKDKRQKTKDKSQKPKDKRQKTKDKRQTSKDKRQKTNDKRQNLPQMCKIVIVIDICCLYLMSILINAKTASKKHFCKLCDQMAGHMPQVPSF